MARQIRKVTRRRAARKKTSRAIRPATVSAKARAGRARRPRR